MEDVRTIKLISEAGQTIVISEDGTDYVLDQDGLDLGSVSSTHNMTQYIDLIGQHLDTTILSPRDITIVGWVIGANLTEINKHKKLLNKAINPMCKVKLEIGNYALSFVPDSSVQYSTEWNYNNRYMCKFQIQGTAPMPLYTLKDYTVIHQTAEKLSSFHFPFSIPKETGVKLGYYSLESTLNTINEGDVENGLVMTLTVKEGTVTNPKIINSTTGDQIELKMTLGTEDKLVIDTQIGQQTVTLVQGTKETNAMKYLTLESDIDMALALGHNRILATADSKEEKYNLHLYAEFTPRFLEVEGREDED